MKLDMKVLLFVMLLLNLSFQTQPVSDEHKWSTTAHWVSNVHRNVSTTMATTSSFRDKYCNRGSGPVPVQLAAVICLIIFIPLTVFGNIIVGVVVLMSPVLRKQTTYIFLASLALADTLIGVVSMTIKAKISWNNGLFCLPTHACWIFLLGETTLSIASVTHLFVLALDRYISLKYTFRYEELLTRKRLYWIIASIWIYSISWSLMGVFQWNDPNTISILHRRKVICAINNRVYYTVLYVICFVIPIVWMIYSYAFVYKTAVRHINEILKVQVASNSIKEARKKKKQYRTLRSVVIVFAVYTICWFPTIVFILSTYYGEGYKYWKSVRDTTWFQGLLFILLSFLPPLNSTTNPFIYVLTNKQFKLSFKQLLGNLTHHRFNRNKIKASSDVSNRTTVSNIRMSRLTRSGPPSNSPYTSSTNG